MLLDPAIARAISDASTDPPECTPHGGSGFSKTYKLTIPSSSDGPSTNYFLKLAPGSEASTMFAGEHASLSAIHSAVPALAPTSIAHGECENEPGTFFLLTEFVDFSASGRVAGDSLAKKLAKLHTTPAPAPEGRERPAFGFEVTTCCGDTPQDNEFCDSWAEFYGERRLKAILKRGQSRNGNDKELAKLIDDVVDKVVPRLLGDGHLGGEEGIVPVVVHGDLWSGNHGKGKVGGREDVEEVVFDPSSCYAHSEFELGIMRMFGGFGGGFLKEYHELCPKTEPKEEYEDRVDLYELYHHLNHWSIFGGGYRSGAMRLMKGLLKKYG